MTRRVRHFHSVLERDLSRWLSLGWYLVKWVRRPSVAGRIAVIEYETEGDPPMVRIEVRA
jgi:hypothetical protein